VKILLLLGITLGVERGGQVNGLEVCARADQQFTKSEKVVDLRKLSKIIKQ